MERFKNILTPEQIKAWKLEQQLRSLFIQHCAESLTESSTYNTPDTKETHQPQAVY